MSLSGQAVPEQLLRYALEMSLTWRTAILSLTIISFPAHAYLGPGLGVGFLGVIGGLLTSIVLAAIAFFWYPLKRKFSGTDKDTENADEADEDAKDQQLAAEAEKE